MARYLARRALLLLPVMLGVTLVVFAMMHLAPGDPAVVMAGPRATPEILAEVRRYLGLDQPLVWQYVTWIAHAVQGDLGRSIRQGEQVTSLVLPRFQDSAMLGLTELLAWTLNPLLAPGVVLLIQILIGAAIYGGLVLGREIELRTAVRDWRRNRPPVLT